MIKNNLMSFPESRSPLDYPILTPSVSFISLYDSFEVDLIHSLGTLTLTDIDNVSIMKFSVSPKSKRAGITIHSDPKHASYMGIKPRQIPILGVYFQRLGDISRNIYGMPDNLI